METREIRIALRTAACCRRALQEEKDGGEKESGLQPMEDQASLLIMEAWMLSIACILQQIMVLAAHVLHV